MVKTWFQQFFGDKDALNILWNHQYIVGAAKMAQRSQQLRWHMGCPAIEPVKNDRSGFRQYVPCIRDGAWKQAYCKDAIFVHVKLFGIYIFIFIFIFIYITIVSPPSSVLRSQDVWWCPISSHLLFCLLSELLSFLEDPSSTSCVPLLPSFPSVAVVAAKKYTCSLLLASLLLIYLILINIYSFLVLGLHMAFQIAIL